MEDKKTSAYSPPFIAGEIVSTNQTENRAEAAARIKAEFFVRLTDYADPSTHGVKIQHDDYCFDLIEELDEIDPLAALLMTWRERYAFAMQHSNGGCCAKARTEMWDIVADELESTLRDGSAI